MDNEIVTYKIKECDLNIIFCSQILLYFEKHDNLSKHDFQCMYDKIIKENG